MGRAATLAGGFPSTGVRAKRKPRGGQCCLLSPFPWSVAWYRLSRAGHRRWEGKKGLALTGSGHGCSRSMTACAEKGFAQPQGSKLVMEDDTSVSSFAAAMKLIFYDPVRGQKNIFNLLLQLWGRKMHLPSLLRSLSLPRSLGLECMKQLCAMQCDGLPKRSL